VIFSFPQLKDGIVPASIGYQRFQDADLATIDAAKAAAGVKLAGQAGKSPRYMVLVVLAGLLLAAVLWFSRRLKQRTQVATHDLTTPAEPTPFSTVAFLRRIRAEHARQLSERDMAALNAQIGEIETGFFSGGPPPPLDLAAIAGKWLGVVRRS